MHNFSAQVEGSDGALVEVQVVQAKLGTKLSETLEEVYALNLEGRLRAGMLIVRLPVEESWNPVDFAGTISRRAKIHIGNTADQRKELFARARDRSVHLLGSYDGDAFVTANINPHWPFDPLEFYKISPGILLDVIRKAEMEYILECSRAVLTLPAGSKYLAPSRTLIQSFVRVGNVQYDRDAIDAVTFWLLPYMKNVGAIITDTWSISSIAFNVARVAAAYFGGQPPRVEMLPNYNDGSDLARVSARRILERLEGDWTFSDGERPVLLCLISATQTGSLAQRLQTIFATSDFKLQPRFVSLFRLGRSTLPALHDLSSDRRFSQLSNPESSGVDPPTPVRIDPQVYFPLNFQDRTIILGPGDAGQSRAFFDKYLGKGLFQVHRDHEETDGKPRHHGIHLATHRLMEIPEFVSSFEAKLATLPTAPRLIVSPPHQAGRLLASHAHKYFGRAGHDCPIFAHPHLGIPAAPPREDERLLRAHMNGANEDESILIIDDVFITGTRLSQYQKYIRTEHFRGRIDYLVGIARPQALSIWDNYKRYLGYRTGNLMRHTVSAVECVILPDWETKHCPWCVEKRTYQLWLDRHGALPGTLMDRLELLSRSSAEGLMGDLFLQFPKADSFRLGPDSMFVAEHASQAEVFSAIAAALQVLRTKSTDSRPKLGPRRFPIATVLHHIDYCQAKWTDSILRASLLRAATVDELVYSDDAYEQNKSAALLRLIEQSAEKEHEIALELLLAASEEKWRLDASDKLRALLKSYGAPDAIDYILDRVAELEPRF